MELMEVLQNEPTKRPFACSWDQCTKQFNRKSDLDRHYRIHTNDRPFACTFAGCGKQFIQRSALTVHIRTHTGDKPHKCMVADCGKRFSDSSSLARHRRIHSGKRPYKCSHEGCAKSFCRKTTMVKHQRRSHQGGGGESNDMNDEDTSDSNGEQTPSTPALMPPGWPLDLYTTSHAQIPSVAQVNRPDAVETRHHSENFLASDDGHPRKIARPLATQYAGRQLPLHQQQTTQASLPSIQPWQHSGYPPQHSQQFGNTGQDEQSGQQQQPFVGRTMSDSQHQYVSGPQITQRLGSPASFSSASVPTPPPQQLYALPANAQQYSLPHLVPKSSSYAPQYEEQPIQGSVPYSHNLVSAPMSRPALQVVTGPLSRPSDFCQMPTLYTQHMQQQTPQGPIYSQNGQNVQHVQQQQMPHVSMYGHNAQNVHQQEIGMGPGYGYSGQHVQSSQQPDFVASAPMSATVPFIYQQQQPAANGNGMFASPNDQYGGSHSATF